MGERHWAEVTTADVTTTDKNIFRGSVTNFFVTNRCTKKRALVSPFELQREILSSNEPR